MNVHYFNHTLFPGILANKIARISMTNSFAKNENIDKVYFYFITNNKKTLSELRKNFNKKVVLKPIFIPFYVDTETKHSIKKYFILPSIMVYLKFIFIMLFKKFNDDDLVYIRGDAPVVAAVIKKVFKSRFRFMFELHNLEFIAPYSLKDRFYAKAFNYAERIITVSYGTKKSWISSGFDKNKIEVIPSGVDIEAFDKIIETKGVIRRKLGLPIKSKIVMYSGQLHDWKGVDTLIDAFSYIRKKNIMLYILGGMSEDVKSFESYIKDKKIKNVTLLGNKSHDMVPYYLKAADLLVLPNTAKNKISLVHTSPIKLLEYMASKTPIIASSLPSIRQIVDETDVIFFKPDNPQDLYLKILLALQKSKTLKCYASNAYKKVKKYTWESRVNKIMSWLKK